MISAILINKKFPVLFYIFFF